MPRPATATSSSAGHKLKQHKRAYEREYENTPQGFENLPQRLTRFGRGTSLYVE
ncbi:hypothetical protein E4U30_008396, partial [Claviceps sp. LM220 group G6]